MDAKVDEKGVSTAGWQDELYDLLRRHNITQFCYVPDAGHAVLIDRSLADPDVHSIALTTEEEGVALVAGADLGGARAVLLMQSSGVGNCINMLSMLAVCQIPLTMPITMRGDWSEFNPWQVPMGQAARSVLEAMGVLVSAAQQEAEVVPFTEGALRIAYNTFRPAAVLIGQRVLGAKTFME